MAVCRRLRALSVNHATIARRLHALEAAMGEKLVDRRPEGYALTLAGSRALSVAGDMEAAVQTLGRGGTDNMLRGVVRVNAPPGIGAGLLIGRLAELSMRYPGLDIDVATDFRSVSLERHEDGYCRPRWTSAGRRYSGTSADEDWLRFATGHRSCAEMSRPERRRC